MLERIDPKLRGGEALPVAGGASRQPRQAPRRGSSPSTTTDDDEPTERIDEALARLAAVIADVERLAREEAGEASAAFPASPGEVAARISRDGASALAAQASLGPAGVRLVLEAGDVAPDEPK